MPKMTIPQIRDEMQALAGEQRLLTARLVSIAKRYEALAKETYRRSYSRAPVKSRRITAAIRASVRDYAAAHPAAAHQDIAEAHDINIGRVSEILHGKR